MSCRSSSLRAHRRAWSSPPRQRAAHAAIRVACSPSIPIAASIPVPATAAMTAPAKSPSSRVRTRAPAAATSVMISWCLGRSRITTVRSCTLASRANAMRRRLSAIESSRSIAPRAPGPATIFSTYQTGGSFANPPGSTATMIETAFAEPRATWLAPSTGKSPTSTMRSPAASDVPKARFGSSRGPSTTGPEMPDSSSTRLIASPATSLTRSGSPLPSSRAQASAAASVAWTSSSDSSPRAMNEGTAPLCCSMGPLGGLGLFQQLRGTQLHLVDSALQERRSHEVPEKGVRAVRPGAELRMELARDEPWVVCQLDDLDQPAVRRHAAEHHAGLAHHLAVLVVELEAMAVTLVHDLLTVRLVRQRSGEQLAGIQAEPHRSAHLVDVSLLGHEVNDRCRGERRELRGVRVRRVEHLARALPHRALHAKAKAKVWNPVVPGISRRLDLPLDAAISEAPRHHDAGDSHQRRRVARVDLFR